MRHITKIVSIVTISLLALIVSGIHPTHATITSNPGMTQLNAGTQVSINGPVQTLSGDFIDRASWVGNQYFLDIRGAEGNQLHALIEFYFAMSSPSKAADFYVVRILSKTTPNPDNGNWRLDSSGVDDPNGPANRVSVAVDSPAAIRWDWNNPSSTYDFAEDRIVTVTETYSVSASLEGKIYGCIEGGACASTTGTIDAGYQVTNQYTVALYKWTIRPTGGSTNFRWDLGLNKQGLPAERNEGVQEDFLVVTVPHASTASINNIQFDGYLWQTCWLCAYGHDWGQISSITFHYYPTITINSCPTTDTYPRSHGRSIDTPLPNPWWPPYQSGYEFATSSTCISNTIEVQLGTGSHYVQYAASGFTPSYAWHAQIYINGVLTAEGDVGRTTPLTAYFNV
jgi:hypothetical protein